MKRRLKLALLALSSGTITLFLVGGDLGGCARFWGDVVGDALWLGLVE